MYGSPRVQAKLKELGNYCFRKRVARLMKENGIAAKMRKN
ncbi:MAG: transposase [Chlamydiae bacterium]|nr:transposase [Chlamydiota bacterium]